MNKRSPIVVLLLILLAGLSLVVQGQERYELKPGTRSISYGFVSPNTREDLKLDDAIRNLHSAEEVRIIQETRYVACRVGFQPPINKSLGNWADGAENALIFRMHADEPTMRYAVASVGKTWRQKTVLYFRTQAGGNGRMYLISIRQRGRGLGSTARAVSKTLDSVGVSYRTLVPLKSRMLVYIVDLRNELKPQVRKAAQQLHSRSLSFTGTGALIGNDNDRELAQGVFTQEIKSFEANHSLSNRCQKAQLEERPKYETNGLNRIPFD